MTLSAVQFMHFLGESRRDSWIGFWSGGIGHGEPPMRAKGVGARVGARLGLLQQLVVRGLRVSRCARRTILEDRIWSAPDFDFLKSSQVPVFIDSDGRPVFNTARGERKSCVVVTSFPKAGTYFFGALLNAIGYAEVGIHAGNSVKSGFEDHRFADYTAIQRRSHLLYRDLAVTDYMRLTMSGQYLVGHIVWDAEHEKAFSEAGVKVLVAVRNLRFLLFSHMRYLTDIDRQDSFRHEWFEVEGASERLRAHNHAYAASFLELFEGILAWTRQPNVPAQLVRFEDFNTRDGRPALAAAAELERFLRLPRTTLNENSIREAQATKTLTRNDIRTEIKPIWDDRVEEGFVSDGYAALNEKLGYA